MGVRAGLLTIALLSLAEFSVTGPRIAHAQERPAQGRHVSVGLVADTRGIVPGHAFHLALRQQIEAGWHTYWLNPGDAGLPTTIDWSLPADFKAGPILWPQPERIAYGPVVDYGYENEVLLPVDIDVPSTVALGTNVVMAGHASWLVCSDTCVPHEDARLSTFPSLSPLRPRLTRIGPNACGIRPYAAASRNPFPTTASAVNAENITLTCRNGRRQKTPRRDVLPGRPRRYR